MGFFMGIMTGIEDREMAVYSNTIEIRARAHLWPLPQ